MNRVLLKSCIGLAEWVTLVFCLTDHKAVKGNTTQSGMNFDAHLKLLTLT